MNVRCLFSAPAEGWVGWPVPHWRNRKRFAEKLARTKSFFFLGVCGSPGKCCQAVVGQFSKATAICYEDSRYVLNQPFIQHDTSRILEKRTKKCFVLACRLDSLRPVNVLRVCISKLGRVKTGVLESRIVKFSTFESM